MLAAYAHTDRGVKREIRIRIGHEFDHEQAFRMTTEELIRRLLKTGIFDQASLAEAVGVSQSTVSRWLKGTPVKHTERLKKIEDLARRHNVLTPRNGEVQTSLTVPIVGLVGLGEEINWMGDGDITLGEVELPFRLPEGCAALEARGGSMAPRIKDGELVVIRKNGIQPEELIGEEAVVKVKDGPYLYKIIRKGYEPGRFNLQSLAADLLENQEIEWVAEVWTIVPRRQWKKLR